MNKKSKIAIGIIAALITFGSLMALVGKNHCWNERHCHQEQRHSNIN